ncbi:MAG TPA: MBL fold metallo-hydrolase [Ignavibacteriaceae bacterium]|nr:ribonuclease Z [Ignavibacterium sp.]HMN24635.1 MBL fold metallo-hydrolase [Ignavibacteriaceae bacterium]
MNIKFLGTGSGVTLLHRFHSSFLITSSNYNLLVDCGDGISKAILSQNIEYNSIDSILISHFHADHYSGLPSLITQMKIDKRKKDISIFVHSSEKDFLEDFILHSYLFKERMTFDLRIVPFNEENEIIINNKFRFVSKINSHLNKYKKHNKENKLGCVSLSFLFKDDENSCIYTGDVADVADLGEELDLFLFNQKVDWFISEVTHISLNSLITVLQNLDPRKIILTHIDDATEEVVKVFLKSILRSVERERFITAFDGLELNQST